MRTRTNDYICLLLGLNRYTSDYIDIMSQNFDAELEDATYLWLTRAAALRAADKEDAKTELPFAYREEEPELGDWLIGECFRKIFKRVADKYGEEVLQRLRIYLDGDRSDILYDNEVVKSWHELVEKIETSKE